MSAALLAALVLQANPAPAAGPDRSPAEAAIAAADQEWLRVFAAKDLDRSVEACAEQASVLAPNAPRAAGRDAIRQLFSGFFALPDLAISWSPSEVHVARSGDLGYSTGSYRMTFKDPAGKTVSDHGKYVTVWEKRGSGWKVAVDAFNSDVPEAPPPQ